MPRRKPPSPHPRRLMISISRMKDADMAAFIGRYPAFQASLADNVTKARNVWLADGMAEATADAAAAILWRRGVRAARLEEAAHALKKFSASDIGWETRRRREAAKNGRQP